MAMESIMIKVLCLFFGLACALEAFVQNQPKPYQCTCASSHPQQLFCDSHFALSGVVSSEDPEVVYGDVFEHGKVVKRKVSKKYQVTVIKVFRGKEILLGIPIEGEEVHDLPTLQLSTVNIHTPYEEEACGINLEFGVQYLIYGMRNGDDKLETKLCNFFAEWEEIENQISRGVLGDYDCRCKVETGITLTDQYDYNVRKNNTCVFNISPSDLLDECAMNFLTCRKLVTPIDGDGYTEQCVWVEGVEYEKCKDDTQHVVDVV